MKSHASTPEGAKPVFRSEIPVRWGDQDALNHVNNTIYFRYMEQARVEWLDSVCARERQTQNQGAVLVTASCTFLMPILYPATVICDIFVGKPGHTSLPTFYELHCKGSDQLYATGEGKLVWVDKRSGKPIPLPAVLRDIWLSGF
jgi:acyl-CoA thioester hydrolase